GSEGDPEKRSGGDAATALRADPYHEGGYRTAEVVPDRVVILRPDGSEYLEVPRHRWRRIRIRDATG
ncbi:MAG: hypothetical protein J2P43_14995, partial [Candidatus Dormibacteraeota bacterium]|nr:hypothetical protein [Candidatus Dormibacteraeota bacterium]